MTIHSIKPILITNFLYPYNKITLMRLQSATNKIEKIAESEEKLIMHFRKDIHQIFYQTNHILGKHDNWYEARVNIKYHFKIVAEKLNKYQRKINLPLIDGHISALSEQLKAVSDRMHFFSTYREFEKYYTTHMYPLLKEIYTSVESYVKELQKIKEATHNLLRKKM